MRLLCALALLAITSSALLEKADDAGQCTGEEKACAEEEHKKVDKEKKRVDPSIMWRKPRAARKNYFYDAEGQFESKTARAVLKKLEEKPRILEEKCSQLTGICYEVIDRVWRDADRGDPNEWELLRQVSLKGNIDAHFGRATLYKPRELNWTTFDTKKWRIHKGAIVDHEIQALIGGVTGSKAVPRREQNVTRDDYYILLMGLGTPIIPNFVQKYHWMDVLVVEKEPLFVYFARKWFELLYHPSLRVIEDDPVSYATHVAASGFAYDAVIVNECKNLADGHPCPAAPYLQRSTVSLLRQIVKEETGAITVNARSPDPTFVKTVANTYGSVFPMCFDYPADKKKYHFERYKSAVCYNREADAFWVRKDSQYILDSTHDWCYFV